MTKITVQDLLTVAESMGAEVKAQKSFFKIVSPTKNRKACYVGITKRTVTRVDFSGFEPSEHEAIKLLSETQAKELNLGAVRGQIAPKELPENVSDESILACFKANLETVLADSEGFKLGARAPKEEEAEVTETPEAPQEEEAQVAADEG